MPCLKCGMGKIVFNSKLAVTTDITLASENGKQFFIKRCHLKTGRNYIQDFKLLLKQM